MSCWPPQTPDSWRTWGFVFSELNWHCQDPNHAWIDTLNRLLRKSPFLLNCRGDRLERADIPTVTADALEASDESWSLSDLMMARHATIHKRTNPFCDTCPIILIELFGKHFVLDGSTRLNSRIEEGDEGPHSVILLRYVPDKTSNNRWRGP